MIPVNDPRFTPFYKAKLARHERVRSALIEYLENEEKTLVELASDYGFSLQWLRKQIFQNILPEYRREPRAGRKAATEPSPEVQEVLLLALAKGHEEAAAVCGVSVAMSKYYRVRWQPWLLENNYMEWT